MSVRYYKLFDLLNRKGMKKSDLRQILSSATVAKLSKGEYISGEAIEKICRFLHCQPGDIMEIVTYEPAEDKNSQIVKTEWITKEPDGTIITYETSKVEFKEKDSLTHYIDEKIINIQSY